MPTRKEQAEALLRQFVRDVAEATCELVAERIVAPEAGADPVVMNCRKAWAQELARATEGSATPDSPYARLLAMVGDGEAVAYNVTHEEHCFGDERIATPQILVRAHPPAPSTDQPCPGCGGPTIQSSGGLICITHESRVSCRVYDMIEESTVAEASEALSRLRAPSQEEEQADGE